jgi:hypothetical protein
MSTGEAIATLVVTAAALLPLVVGGAFGNGA